MLVGLALHWQLPRGVPGCEHARQPDIVLPPGKCEGWQQHQVLHCESAGRALHALSSAVQWGVAACDWAQRRRSVFIFQRVRNACCVLNRLTLALPTAARTVAPPLPIALPLLPHCLFNTPRPAPDGAAVNPGTGTALDEPQPPVVWFGTSIVQGGAASRPGAHFINGIARSLGRPVINWGFAGPSTRPKSASRSLRRALLTPQVNTGSLYRRGRSS